MERTDMFWSSFLNPLFQWLRNQLGGRRSWLTLAKKNKKHFSHELNIETYCNIFLSRLGPHLNPYVMLKQQYDKWNTHAHTQTNTHTQTHTLIYPSDKYEQMTISAINIHVQVDDMSQAVIKTPLFYEGRWKERWLSERRKGETNQKGGRRARGGKCRATVRTGSPLSAERERERAGRSLGEIKHTSSSHRHTDHVNY